MKIDNYNYANIIGVGDACVQIEIGCTLTLKNVWHILDLCLNMISTNTLDIIKFHNYFGKRK